MRDVAGCPFCELLGDGLPAHAIWEDGTCFVLLDRESLGFGHCMVIPRRHVGTVYDLPEDDYCAVFRVARELAPRLARATNQHAVGYVTFGTGLPHAHLHLVPMSQDSVLSAPRPTLLSDDTLTSHAQQLRSILASEP
jgi:histidine triad (HIT) family protein